jgi:hypothetical protein
MITWKTILSLLWEKVSGSSNRAKEFAEITKLWKGLYEEKKKIADEYFKQLNRIEALHQEHPENGKELQMWKDREYKLMMELVKAHEMISFYRERSIFLEHEIDLLFNKLEKRGE